MAGFLNQFRERVIASVWKDKPDESKIKEIDDKIALGVLLWVVAEADEKFMRAEAESIKKILLTYSKIPEEDIPYVISSIERAADERIDLYRFTHEISENLKYEVKISIIKILFRVACADKELDEKELQIIRKISGLFGLAHRDFIDAKIEVKKEFGLKTIT